MSLPLSRPDQVPPWVELWAQRRLALRNEKGNEINATKRSSPYKARTNAATQRPLRRASIKAIRDKKSAENKLAWEAKNIAFMAAQEDAFKSEFKVRTCMRAVRNHTWAGARPRLVAAGGSTSTGGMARAPMWQR